MNSFKQTVPVKEEKPRRKSSGMKNGRKFFRLMDMFNNFSRDMLLSIMPYIFFLTLVALIYIANSYYSEKTIREIDATGKELKTLRTEYLTGMSELMLVNKQSEVARAVAPQGIKEAVEAPRKIVVKQLTEKTGN